MYFPFEKIRPIQQELINDVTHAIDTKRHLIAHAPTGLGKTAATLGPALTVALEKGYSVFFLTPKHSQHQIAIETLQKIKQKHGIDVKATDLIGKKWMCSHGGVERLSSKEFNEFCKSLREGEKCTFYNAVFGTKNQLQGSAMDMLMGLKKKSPIHAEELFEMCKEDFCSYELASLLGKDSQVIIADYYHIFQPSVRQFFLGRLKKELKNSILIIDEGHNLPSRVRDILSAKLNNFIINRAAKEAKAFHFDDLSEALENLNNTFYNLKKSALKNSKEAFISKKDFIDELQTTTQWAYEDLYSDLESASAEIRKSAKKSFVGSVSEFLEMWTGDDAGYSRILRTKLGHSERQMIELSYNCLSPAISAGEVINESVSTILMSGTLVPGEMYRDLLGFPENRTDLKTYASPFPPENRLVLIDTNTTTKFTSRTADEFQKIARDCIDIVKSVPNNCAIFFPSYYILQAILPFMEGKTAKEVFIDSSELKKSQRAELLNQFKLAASNGNGGLLLAVQGGSMSEGIDLPGDFLKCAIVVGVPLANPDLATKSLIEFYDYKYNKGWDYGYTHPAMTRAIQAAGRCIRRPEDKGAVVFLDKRFAWGSYLKCLPPEWKPIATKLTADKIKRFFNSQ
ncbi:MAG TPA: ATP-dependent DNA helicase [Nanoarchaeota archaeon]|nr:ATP-dependent DNA helicase [Nanoarchaeota archaeon]